MSPASTWRRGPTACGAHSPNTRKKGCTRRSSWNKPGLLDERFRFADRPNLGDVATEGQACRPVEHRAELAGGAGNLAHVVSPSHPPGGEAAEGGVADPADRFVGAEVDEGRFAAVLERARRADPQLGGDVARRDGPLADCMLRGRRA